MPAFQQGNATRNAARSRELDSSPLQPLLPGGLHVNPVPRPLSRPYELTEVSIVLSKHMGHDGFPEFTGLGSFDH